MKYNTTDLRKSLKAATNLKPGDFITLKHNDPDSWVVAKTDDTNAYASITGVYTGSNGTPVFQTHFQQDPVTTNKLRLRHKFKVGDIIWDTKTSPNFQWRVVNILEDIASYSLTTISSWLGRTLTFEDAEDWMLVTPTPTPTPTPKPMKLQHLTTYNRWIIALNLETQKLVAFTEGNTTIEAVGSLLSAGGRAWMWKDAKLWSGELFETETTSEKRQKLFGKLRELCNSFDPEINDLYSKFETEQNKIIIRREEAADAFRKEHNL